MKRREFITLLGGGAVWPLAARAQQQAGKLPTIGFLGANTPSAASQWVAAFVQRLRELDWIEGRTVAIEYRWAEGRSERFAEIAAELVRLKVDVIVTSGTPQVLAASPLFNSAPSKLVALAMRNRIPTMYFQSEFVQVGGLISYGSNYASGFAKWASTQRKSSKGPNPLSCRLYSRHGLNW